jgi:hypothetical protein
LLPVRPRPAPAIRQCVMAGVWDIRLAGERVGVGHMRSAPPPSSIIRTPISAAAYAALAASSMRLLVLGAQRSPQGGYAVWLDEK